MRIPKPEIAPEAVLAVLNSRLIAFYIHKTFTAYKRLFPQLNQTTIESVPLPGGMIEKQGRIIAPAREMLNLQEELAKSKTDPDQIMLRRRIEFTDQELDGLVYELYGLTKEEIVLVEEATK